jgi:hypothetical protein
VQQTLASNVDSSTELASSTRISMFAPACFLLRKAVSAIVKHHAIPGVFADLQIPCAHLLVPLNTLQV